MREPASYSCPGRKQKAIKCRRQRELADSPIAYRRVVGEEIADTSLWNPGFRRAHAALESAYPIVVPVVLLPIRLVGLSIRDPACDALDDLLQQALRADCPFLEPRQRHAIQDCC